METKLNTRLPAVLELRLDWSEMDLFGHINNVMYMKYIQASRVNYWDQVSLMRFFEKDKTGPVLLSTSCRFIKPLHYPGNITVRAGVEFMKNSSFGIHHQIFNQQNEICAEAHDVIVMFDFAKNEKVNISEELREEIVRFEGIND